MYLRGCFRGFASQLIRGGRCCIVIIFFRKLGGSHCYVNTTIQLFGGGATSVTRRSSISRCAFILVVVDIAGEKKGRRQQRSGENAQTHGHVNNLWLCEEDWHGNYNVGVALLTGKGVVRKTNKVVVSNWFIQRLSLQSVGQIACQFVTNA